MENSFYTQSDLLRLGLLVPEIRFAEEIERFAEADRVSPPPAGGLLLAGDSDIRLWDRQSADSLLPGGAVTNRGFGGARTWETVLYFPQAVLPARPRAIVYCAGDNDMSVLKADAPANIVAMFRLFLDLVERHLPDCRRVFFLAVHPTPRTMHKAAWIDLANKDLRRLCGDSPIAEFVDYLALLNEPGGDGRLRTDCFRKDQFHFSVPFYRELSAFLRPRVARAFA
jgi:lysophospholipase L1-like esterase